MKKLALLAVLLLAGCNQSAIQVPTTPHDKIVDALTKQKMHVVELSMLVVYPGGFPVYISS